MIKNATSVPEVFEIEPRIVEDERGCFMESWSVSSFQEMGIKIDFVECSERLIRTKGMIRGLHFQNAPASQAKLVRVSSGAILDVAVDLRRGSPTYLNWTVSELSAENRKMVLIPRGFAHGLLTLTDDVRVSYMLDAPYTPSLERVIRFDDPAIGIDWGISNPILSRKDANAPLLSDSDCNFIYSGY